MEALTPDERGERENRVEAWKEQIREADIIIGVNIATGAETIFFGPSPLQLTTAAYEGETEELRPRIVRIPLDFESDEPEILAAACDAIKGRHDVT